MKLQQIRKIAKHWQKQLGLVDWKISVVWAKPDMLDKDGEITYAQIEYDAHRLEATVHIRKDEHDYEDTIIHELCHLFLFPLENAAGFSIKPSTDQWETAMEQTVNKLTKILKEKPNG